MDAARALGIIGRGFGALGLLGLAAPRGLEAQVGLASRVARVALEVRVPSRASIDQIGSPIEITRPGGLREGTVKVRLSANTGYRLVVVGTAPASSNGEPSSRLWVRAVDGHFEEIRLESAVTVARDHHVAGESEREVTYRSEASESGEGPHLLPVRYEFRIDPAI